MQQKPKSMSRSRKPPPSVSLLSTSKDEEEDHGEDSPRKNLCHSPIFLDSAKPFNKEKGGEDETVDTDAIIESDIFENRQELLNYCTKTNCQFDELRRAKHTTMMLLFQLHNPNAARYMPQCGR